MSIDIWFDLRYLHNREIIFSIQSNEHSEKLPNVRLTAKT